MDSLAVTEIEVLQSVAPLDDSAVEAVCPWKYYPARLEGEPIKYFLSVYVSFAIRCPPTRETDTCPPSPLTCTRPRWPAVRSDRTLWGSLPTSAPHPRGGS